MRILVAEDDALLGDAIAEHLRRAGHTVDWVRDGTAADAALRTEPYKLAVLDLGLPRLSGRDVLVRLRKRAAHTPVLIITAADAIADRVAGLDAGEFALKPANVQPPPSIFVSILMPAVLPRTNSISTTLPGIADAFNAGFSSDSTRSSPFCGMIWSSAPVSGVYAGEALMRFTN